MSIDLDDVTELRGLIFRNQEEVKTLSTKTISGGI
jgi:hypothetical protein